MKKQTEKNEMEDKYKQLANRTTRNLGVFLGSFTFFLFTNDSASIRNDQMEKFTHPINITKTTTAKTTTFPGKNAKRLSYAIAPFAHARDNWVLQHSAPNTISKQHSFFLWLSSDLITHSMKSSYFS